MLNIVLNNVAHVEPTRRMIRERFLPLLREFPDLREHETTFIVDGASDAERMRGRPLSVRAVVQGEIYRIVVRLQTVSDIDAATANVTSRLWRRLRRSTQRAIAAAMAAYREPVPHAA